MDASNENNRNIESSIENFVENTTEQQKLSRTVCAVPGCKQRYGQNVSFHSFPKKKDRSRWNLWIQKT